MWPEYPGKDRQGESCSQHSRESGPEVEQGPDGVIRSRPRLSRLDVEPAELSEIVENYEVLRVLVWLLPLRPSWEEKRAWQWMNKSKSMESVSKFWKIPTKIFQRSYCIWNFSGNIRILNILYLWELKQNFARFVFVTTVSEDVWKFRIFSLKILGFH